MYVITLFDTFQEVLKTINRLFSFDMARTEFLMFPMYSRNIITSRSIKTIGKIYIDTDLWIDL
jgi:hypothetical protein